jgi:peptidoglycan hydrolase-like protein with peptidoglycan-binding domain
MSDQVDIGKQKTLFKTAFGITDQKKAYWYVYNPEDEELPLYICKNRSERDAFIKKKKLQVNAVATGPCFGAGDNEGMVFKVKKMMSNLEKKLIEASRGLGKKVSPDIRLLSEKEEKEVQGADSAAAVPSGKPTLEKEKPSVSAPDAAGGAAAPDAGAAAGGATAGTSPTSAAAGGKKVDNDLMEVQKALKELSKKNKSFDPVEVDGLMGPHSRGAIKAFQKANGLKEDGAVSPELKAALDKATAGGAAAAGGAPGGKAADAAGGGKAPPSKLNLSGWQASLAKAIKDLLALAKKVVDTEHPSAEGVDKEIRGLCKDLGEKNAPKPEDLAKLEEFIKNHDTISAAEDVPASFATLKIRDDLLKQIKTMKQQAAV